MKLGYKTALWLAASVFFFAGVSAGTAGGTGVVGWQDAKTDSVVGGGVDSVEAKASTVGDEPDPASVVDEVIWVVGDEPILLSDVENVKLQSELEGVKWDGNPDCKIPEQLAVQKLFLHQAAIDSIEVSESEVSQGVERQINMWIQMVGGDKERLEEYKNMSLSEMRQSLHDDFRDRLLIDRERENLVADMAVSPADVRRYFDNLPEDSLPIIPTEVEVQIITRTPKVDQEEIDRVKNTLREYTDRVTSGETSFATLARLYSEDPGTARQGGEFEDYVGRGMLDPTFASVAFNLTDPKKISKIVETEFGFHIIQLIDKRGDKIKVRHILLKPKVTQEAIDLAKSQLDSLGRDIRGGKIPFDQAASFISDDKDTRNNNGLMANRTPDGRMTSRFQMRNLPSEVAKVVDTLKVGEVSAPFEMINEKNGRTMCAIVRLKNRIDTHRATITEDFQEMKDIVLAKRKEEFIDNWIKNKIKTTYVRINDRYKSCDFQYEGWIK